MSLMMMDLCTDLMGSGSWILIFPSFIVVFAVVFAPDLCLQPARTIVPEVSYFVIIKYKHQQTNCMFLFI